MYDDVAVDQIAQAVGLPENWRGFTLRVSLDRPVEVEVEYWPESESGMKPESNKGIPDVSGNDKQTGKPIKDKKNVCEKAGKETV